MKCFLIDDEETHRRGLRQLLTLFFSEIEIVGEASSLSEAREWLNYNETDIVFLDVMLGDGTGLDLLKTMLFRSFQVVLVSAHNEFAVEAFRLSALDYLLKPIDTDELREAIRRAKQQIQLSQTHLQLEILRENLEKLTHQNRKMVLRDADTIYVVTLSEIVYCRAEGSYTIFKLTDEREILVSKNLGEYEKLLESAHFVRSHHSYIVNLNQIKKFDKTDGGQLIMNTGTIVPVAVRRKEGLLKAMSEFLQ